MNDSQIHDANNDLTNLQVIKTAEDLVLQNLAALNAEKSSKDALNSSGAETLTGSTGDDVFIVDDKSDVVVEAYGEGYDVVRSSVWYTLQAGAAVERIEAIDPEATNFLHLNGNEYNQVMVGNAGAGTLDGMGGADTMIGGRGDDSYVVKEAGDVVVEHANEGADTVFTWVDFTIGEDVHVEKVITKLGRYNLNVTGNHQANELVGNDGINVFRGHGGKDKLFGHGGSDALFGGSGADLIVGGTGVDALNGGLGADTFSFNLAAGDTGATEQTADIIRDFFQSEGDRIDLSLKGENTGVNGSRGLSFIGTDEFTGADQIRYEIVGSQTHVFINRDGDAEAEAVLRLTGRMDLTSDCFIL